MAPAGQKYMNVDVIAFLEEQMKSNTEHHQSDFDIDKDFISRSLKSPYKEDKALLWMSRKHGTYCHKEYEAFIKGTAAHNTWLYYSDDKNQRIRAFAVELTGQKGDVIRGNVYALNYDALIKELRSKSVDPLEVEKTFEDGFTHRTSLDRSSYGYWYDLVDQHGPVVNSLTFPKDKLSHAEVLYEQRKKREGFKTVSFESPQKKVSLNDLIASAASRTGSVSSGESRKIPEPQL